MRINLDDLRRHYASLPDEGLLDIDPGELSDVARPLYEDELARRQLSAEPRAESLAGAQEIEEPVDEVEADAGPAPDWLDEAACACSFALRSRNAGDSRTIQTRTALRAAGIPCHLEMTREEAPPVDPAPQYVLRVMVPGALALHAMSILDRDILNEEHEAEWRGHLAGLADDELVALDPDIFCAGYLDRVARLRKAYEEELAERRLKRRRQ